MAEFQEVMRLARRMCVTVNDCDQCELMTDAGCRFAIFGDDAKYSSEIEHIVMDWAAKNPEPRYPSWIEWQGANFQMAERAICAAYFMDAGDAGCYVNGRCDKCREKPISADIAEKLGIKPIGGSDNG